MAHYIDYTILSFPAKVKVSTSGGELSKPLKKEMESLVYFFPGRRLQSGAIRGIIYGEQILASVDKSPHGFPGPGQQLASLSSLMGVSPSASSALPSAVHAPGKLEDPPGAPARFSQGRGRRGLTSYRQVCRGPFLWAEALLTQVKDNNAAKGGSERPAGMCVLVS